MGKSRNSRRKRSATRQRQAGGGTAVAEAAPAADDQWLSGYDGANQSLRRGDVFLDLNTRQELDSFSRTELMRRVRWLYINMGFVRGIVRNGAALVGWLAPQAKTGSKDWNRMAEKRFWKRAGRKENFDRAGKYNFRTAQKMIQRAGKKDGDLITVLTTNEEGTAPAVAFYEAHQLANPEESHRSGSWVDGVKVSPKSGRHLAYGLKNEEGKVVVVPASSVIYYGSHDSTGHVRAISPLAHAVNHAIDITEIRADTKHAIKTAGLEALIRTRDKEVKPTKSRQGMPGTLINNEITTASGAKRFQTREVWAGGQATELEAGEDLKMLHDSRPHPNGMEFQQELYRDIAAGYGTHLEAIYNLGRMTGPGVRFMLDSLSRWIGEEQEELNEWALKVYFYFIAWDLTRGLLEYPPEGADWMDVEMIPLRDLTIDRGRDGKQMADEIDRGLGTWSSWHKRVNARDWEDEVAQRIEEVRTAKDLCETAGLKYHEVFPPRAGTAVIEDPEADDAEEPEEEEDKTKGKK